MTVYVFAFSRRNVSVSVMYKLKNIDHRYHIFPNNINRYLEIIRRDRPEYILGLGMYGGRDRDKIRIETKCSNRFRRGFVTGNELEEISMNPFLQPAGLSKLAEGIGYSWCNLMCWKITRLILQEKIPSRFSFLHIPRTMDIESAIEEINGLIAGINTT